MCLQGHQRGSGSRDSGAVTASNIIKWLPQRHKMHLPVEPDDSLLVPCFSLLLLLLLVSKLACNRSGMDSQSFAAIEFFAATSCLLKYACSRVLSSSRHTTEWHYDASNAKVANRAARTT